MLKELRPQCGAAAPNQRLATRLQRKNLICLSCLMERSSWCSATYTSMRVALGLVPAGRYSSTFPRLAATLLGSFSAGLFRLCPKALRVRYYSSVGSKRIGFLETQTDLLAGFVVSPADPTRPFTSQAIRGHAVLDERDQPLAFETDVTPAVSAMHPRCRRSLRSGGWRSTGPGG